jgi:hypothetical protein
MPILPSPLCPPQAEEERAAARAREERERREAELNKLTRLVDASSNRITTRRKKVRAAWHGTHSMEGHDKCTEARRSQITGASLLLAHPGMCCSGCFVLPAPCILRLVGFLPYLHPCLPLFVLQTPSEIEKDKVSDVVKKATVRTGHPCMYDQP